MIKKVQLDNFAKAIEESGEAVILVCFAYWCNDSKRILNNVLPKLEAEFGELVTFLELMLENDHREMGKKSVSWKEQSWLVERYPFLIAFKNDVYQAEVYSEGNVASQEKDVRTLIAGLLQT